MLEIGKVYDHPDLGPIYVLSGQWMGHYGISNHWSWKQILKDGSLGELLHGYGNVWEELPAEVTIKVLLRKKK